jgi:hypothetical protein
LFVDRDTQTWALVGTDADSDRTAVLGGHVGERGAERRAGIPDTVPILGEPIVFDGGATVIFPAFQRQALARADAPALSLLSLAFAGFDGPGTQLWRVHGDSVRPLATLRGATQCGAAHGGSAACIARKMRSTSLYRVSANGEASEIARLALQDVGVVSIGPGPRVASAGFNGSVVFVDLAAQRLTRVSMPPNTSYAMDIAVGPGWIVTLGYDGERRSVVRKYRIVK